MTAVTTHDLMLALLAMDSYNRGNPNKIPLQFAEKGTQGSVIEFAAQIGDATFKYSSDTMEVTNASLSGSIAAGLDYGATPLN